jgi:hypothetical protein
VGSTTELDGLGKIPLPKRFHPRAVQPINESLYRLSYPGPQVMDTRILLNLTTSVT